METTEWYYSDNGQQQGPVSTVELQARLDSQAINGSNLAWNSTMSDWQPIHQLSQFTLPEPSPSPSPAVQYTHQRSADTSPLAIASLVCGIIALILTVCYGIGVLIAIPAIITGHMHFAKAKKQSSSSNSKGLALSGLIMGYTSVFFALILILFIAYVYTILRLESPDSSQNSLQQDPTVEIQTTPDPEHNNDTASPDQNTEDIQVSIHPAGPTAPAEPTSTE